MRASVPSRSSHGALGGVCPVLLVVLCFLFGFSRDATAQMCPTPLIFDVDAVGRCLGNCGIDCSSNTNFTCQDGQGWVWEQYGPPEYVGYTGSIEYCDGDYRCTSTCGMFQFPGRFTYWGVYSPGCYIHDLACRNGDWNFCYFPNVEFLQQVCDLQVEWPWTYEGYARYIDMVDTECVYAWPECPEIYSVQSSPKRTVK